MRELYACPFDVRETDGVRTPGGHRLVVLVNHLKSKGYAWGGKNGTL